jgi:hypothetical protein
MNTHELNGLSLFRYKRKRTFPNTEKISPCGKECGRYKPLAESLK